MRRSSSAVSTGPVETDFVARVAVIASVRGQLMLRLLRARPSPATWVLPAAPLNGDAFEERARRLTRAATGVSPSWLTQMQASSERRVGERPSVVVEYVAVVARPVPDDEAEQRWYPLAALPDLEPWDRGTVERAVDQLRTRIEIEPIAFRMLPETFTLTDLQQIYELLLGRALHKASFRRALFAARLVEPIEEWRQMPRGRPAQLYRYAPRTPRRKTGGVHFDRLD